MNKPNIMYKIIMKTLHLLKFFSFASLIGCGGTQQSALPSQYSIQLNENGGMVPYETIIYLSNKDSSYVRFYVNGLKNKINIFPEEAELIDLVTYINEQKFRKIKTREMEALDRGGDVIKVNFDGESIRVSNMGFSFIKDRWVKQYSNVKDRIFGLAKKHLPPQLQEIEIELDTSMLKNNWQTSLDINNGIFIGKAAHSKENGFQPSFKIDAITGENMVYIHILSDIPGQRRGKTLLNWNKSIQVTKDIHKITFKLIEGGLKAIYNDEKSANENNPIKKPVVLENQNLNKLSESALLQIDLIRNNDDPDFDSFEVAFSIKNKEKESPIQLLKASGSFKDSYADILYTLFETGNSRAPYLLFYSGQAGDEYNTPGSLILFDKEKKIATLPLHDGNRISAELLDIQPGLIKIKEAIICHQAIHTTIAFSELGLERQEGFFPVNSIYPDNGEVPESSSLNTYQLKSDFEVTIGKKLKIFKPGEKITLALQWVDYNLGSVFLKVNEKEAYMELEKFKAHEFIQSMYGAKCEMG